ncbi:MAG: type II CAAX endopeptidase family protein [Carnobacterium sp.]|uniref:CPBP family intramembrane glutamic endopeptidase n=1 Tax=Carnobacterium sp. TaxID=48221 RepID=UPI003315044C
MKKLTSHTSILIILFYLIAQFLPVIIISLAPKNFQTEASVYGTIFSFTLGAVVMLLLNRKSTIRNSLTLSPSLPKKSIIYWGIAGIPLVLLAQYIANLIEILVLDIPVDSVNTQNILLIVNSYPIYMIIVSIMGPIMEEFVFRKVIFGFLYDITGGIGAAVISSLIFAFMHFDGHILLYSAMAFVFCFLYSKTKNIATPIITHIIMNTVVILVNFL